MNKFILALLISIKMVHSQDHIPQWAKGIPNFKTESGWFEGEKFILNEVGNGWIDLELRVFSFRGITLEKISQNMGHDIRFFTGSIQKISVIDSNTINFTGTDHSVDCVPNDDHNFKGYIKRTKTSYKFELKVIKSKNKSITGEETYRTLEDKRAIKLTEEIPIFFGYK